MAQTQADINAKQRERRRRDGNSDTRKYERENPKGFLMRVYRNMHSRVTGVQKREAQYYVGLALLSRETFYLWILADPDFLRLWAEWQDAGRPQRLTPSVDRKDVLLGYELFNIRWVAQAQNSGDLTRRNTTTRARGAAWHAARQRIETCA
jgi:hypothetical protein